MTDSAAPLAYTLQLRRHPANAGRARRSAQARLSAWGVDEEAAATAALLVSELVTNAVRHARAPRGREIGLHLTLDARCLRIEVSDAGSGQPVTHQPGPDNESGRGMSIVAALAERHGVCPRPHGIGKTVWAELALAGPEMQPEKGEGADPA